RRAILFTLVAIAVWAALRAYTGMFEVLTLRIGVGALIVAIPMLAAPTDSQGRAGGWKVLQSLLGVVTVVGGEGLGSLLTGRPPALDKFTLIFFGIAIVLPWVHKE